MGPRSRGTQRKTRFPKQGFLQKNGVFGIVASRLTTKTPYQQKVPTMAEETDQAHFRDRLHELTDFGSKSENAEIQWNLL